MNNRLALACLLFALPTANAMTVYQQGLDVNGFGLNSNLGGGNQQELDNFVLDHDVMLNDVHWYGFFHAGNGFSVPATQSETFTVRLFDFNGGPANNPFYEFTGTPVATDTGLKNTSTYSNPIWKFDLDSVTPQQLFAGLTYGISILDAANPNLFTWSFGSTADNVHYSRSNEGGVWRSSSPDLAFSLTIVPIPTPLMLMASGLVVIIYQQRKKLAS